MGMARPMQRRVAFLNAGVDPGGLAAFRWLRTSGNDGRKGEVDADGESIAAHNGAQLSGRAQPIERNNPALARFDPVKRRIIGAFRHREYASGIGLEQEVRRNVGKLPACHGLYALPSMPPAARNFSSQ